MYKILFCVLKQRGDCLSLGHLLEDVGRGIHLSVLCLLVFAHWLPCAADLPRAMSSAEQHLMLSGESSRQSSAGTREPWQQNSRGLGLPAEGEAFVTAPAQQPA